MPKSVHMHVKNFTCIASIMHVKFEVHMHDKIVSHVWKDFTCNKMHRKKVHTYDKNFSHALQNFTHISKSSHACEMLLWWTCIFSNIDFTWFLFFTHFSHPFHTFFTHSPSSVLWLHGSFRCSAAKTRLTFVFKLHLSLLIHSTKTLSFSSIQHCTYQLHTYSHRKITVLRRNELQRNAACKKL